MTRHLDETGQPCTRHPEVSESRLYELATLGSRMPGFHHDAASKLQSLMMALDEISELSTEVDPIARGAIDTAHAALRELHQLLSANRALAKASVRSHGQLPELVQRAAERVGVKLRGELPECQVQVAVPALTHVIAQLLDLAAGPSHLGRVVDVALEIGAAAVLTMTGPRGTGKTPAGAAEVLALASYVIEREAGTLACAGDERFVVRLPLAGEPAAAP